jgi:hypothetical protein
MVKYDAIANIILLDKNYQVSVILDSIKNLARWSSESRVFFFFLINLLIRVLHLYKQQLESNKNRYEKALNLQISC